MLPILPLQLPLAISDSGDVAVGYGQEITATTVSMFGLRWHGDGGAQLMIDAEHNGAVLGPAKMTNHDGSLAFGVGWSDGDRVGRMETLPTPAAWLRGMRIHPVRLSISGSLMSWLPMR